MPNISAEDVVDFMDFNVEEDRNGSVDFNTIATMCIDEFSEAMAWTIASLGTARRAAEGAWALHDALLRELGHCTTRC